MTEMVKRKKRNNFDHMADKKRKRLRIRIRGMKGERKRKRQS